MKIEIGGESAKAIAERALQRGDLWRKSDPKTSRLRLTEEDKAKLVEAGLIKVPAIPCRHLELK
jgi:hypothetical protein